MIPAIFAFIVVDSDHRSEKIGNESLDAELGNSRNPVTLFLWIFRTDILDARNPAPNGRDSRRPRLPGRIGRDGVDDAKFRLGCDRPRSAWIVASKPEDSRPDRVDLPLCDVDGLGSESEIFLQRCVPSDGRDKAGMGSRIEI